MEAVRIDDHPLLDAAVFRTRFPAPLGRCPSPDRLVRLTRDDAPAPLRSDDDVRAAVRNLLRHGGYKPTGRGKPASEYLLRAASDAGVPSINAAVDACNAVSLHSGLPISVVDFDRATGPFRIGVAPPGSEYVFNPAGQVIRLDGLLCLFDAAGPCANAVKDAQRTKTGDETLRTLTVLWGTNALPGRCRAALDWYVGILEDLGAEVRIVHPPGG